jgi:hypothetical protein
VLHTLREVRPTRFSIPLLAGAEVREIEGVGLELRYYWDAELMQGFLFKDGTDLLKEAQTERFDLEERGWKP